jgi:hypothetical protein
MAFRFRKTYFIKWIGLGLGFKDQIFWKLKKGKASNAVVVHGGG